MKTGVKEQVWAKTPYSLDWEHMYGMTQHQLQFNQLTESLAAHLAPTDTRFRPDQRALENGDFKLAEAEKHRLEEKQRAVRKYNEKNNFEPKPYYFEEWQNPDDPSQVYYKYNGLYFEKDSREKDWSRLPDLYSDKMPFSVE